MSNPVFVDPVSNSSTSPVTSEVESIVKMLESVSEHAKSISEYEQKMVNLDDEARGIMYAEMYDAVKNMGMALQYVINRRPEYAKILREILFRYGNIIEHGDQAVQ